MKISALMTVDIVTVHMDDELAKVKNTFETTQFHHLLVVDNTKLVGVVSDRDLFKAISPNIDAISATNKDLASLNKKVHQIMTRKLLTLKHTATVNDAIELFNNHGISCIPIVDSKNKAVGIVSWRDIMRELGERIQKSNQNK